MNFNKLIYDWSSEQYADRNNLVFEGKNQAYGAYQIRTEYNSVLIKSMVSTFLGIALIACAPLIIHKFFHHEIVERVLPETEGPTILDADQFKKEENILPKEKLEIVKAKVATVFNVVPKVINKPVELDPKLAVQDLLKDASSGTKTETGDNTETTFVVSKPDPVEIVENNNIEISVEKMPTFGNGDEDLFKYMRSSIQYPAFEREAGIMGTVYVYFVINKQGKVEDARIVRGVKGGKGLEAEALRVIQSMPNWSPGMQNGKPAKVQFTYPVKFMLK